MSEKVYCKTCKYCKTYEYQQFARCTHPDHKQSNFWETGDGVCMLLNSKNTCSKWKKAHWLVRLVR